MARYHVDGKILDSELAINTWEESKTWDGNNHISVHTGTQWDHQTLRKSKKGNYWIEHSS